MERYLNINDAPFEVCTRCIYDARVPGIRFNESGVCNYCTQIDELVQQYGTGLASGQSELEKIIQEIKTDGIGKKYDCIVGISGGTDSSYLLYLAKSWGLRPLAVHYDNTWNSAVATQNISKILRKLDIDLVTHVLDNSEANDIVHSFFNAGVPELDAATDLALAETMYRVAHRYRVKYVLEGHSFVTEGITPVGKNYFDGKYIASIHREYGKIKLKSYPLMTFFRFLYWVLFCRIRKIRPFWYLNYSKEEARKFLEKEFNWQYYGGHHLENRITSFAHGVYLPGKFNADLRNNTLSCLVRNGFMTRENAWREYNTIPSVENEIVSYFTKRLGISLEDYEKVMKSSPRYWYEFRSYKRLFELLRPLFFVLAKTNLVPMSFYLKYCFPFKEK